MPLAAGSHLGRYEILALIGVGGMGEVYKSYDPRMGRSVAIKVSAQHFTERFDREVRAAASLNHPNICQIYDVGQDYLVMELIEGESPKGPLPLDTALEYARQIAEALGAAHDKGIVHRDLKPANIKIQHDGQVKVLDFGLAKVAFRSTVSSNSADTPTVTGAQETEAGMILGTPAYMSPEQARGKVVDKRSDIWAFGAVLYELLAGRPLFEGESMSDVLAAVLTSEPRLDLVPEKVRPLLANCLQKDARLRIQDIRDFRLLLLNPPAHRPDSQSDAQKRSRPAAMLRQLWLLWLITAVLLAALAPWIFFHVRSQPAADALARFQIFEPDTQGCIFFLSPDGRTLAYTAIGADGRTRLWIRSLDALEPRMLQGTDDAGGLIWSPDSRYIAFSADGKLKKIDIVGGPPLDLCDLKVASDSAERPEIVPGIRGGSWNKQGVIIFGSGNILYQIPEGGGAPSQLTALDFARQEQFHGRPLFLPDGEHFLYLRSSENPQNSGIYVGSLNSKPGEQQRQRLLDGEIGVAFAPSSGSRPGHLLFLREGVLMAQTFDPRRRQLSGEAVPIAENVGDNAIAAGYFSVSANGVLAYRGDAGKTSQLTLFDRQGKVLRTVGSPGVYNTVTLSPDGSQIAAERIDSKTRQSDLWLFSSEGGGDMRLTFDPGQETSPVWSPDGKRIVFGANRGGQHDVYQKSTSGAGAEELLVQSRDTLIPTSWSNDSRYLLGYHTLGEGHLWLLSLDSGSRDPVPLFPSAFNDVGVRLSGDDRWIAYRSNESGNFEIYVRPFDPSAAAGAASSGSEWMVSKGGGDAVRWRRDSNELFYLAPDGTLMSTEILRTGSGSNSEIQIKAPKPLFRVPASIRFWDVTPSGQQFLFPVPVGRSTPEPFIIVLNWTAMLKS
jgi:eukaryotic-like serine/threonine-protein kinase